jgi:hypothetical protein
MTMTEPQARPEDPQGAFIRRLGQALPECTFSVHGRHQRFKLSRPGEVLIFNSYADRVDRAKHYVVVVLAVTKREADQIRETSRESNKRQHDVLMRQEREAEESAERRSAKMKLLKRAAMVAAILVGSIFLVSPVGATTMVQVDVPPAQQLFLGVDQVPVSPLEVSFLVDGFEIVVMVVPQSDAAQHLPLDLYVAAGPQGSIAVGVPEPDTLALMGLGLLGLVVLGRRRA